MRDLLVNDDPDDRGAWDRSHSGEWTVNVTDGTPAAQMWAEKVGYSTWGWDIPQLPGQPMHCLRRDENGGTKVAEWEGCVSDQWEKDGEALRGDAKFVEAVMTPVDKSG